MHSVNKTNKTFYYVDNISSTTSVLSKPVTDNDSDTNSSLITGIMTLSSRSYVSYKVPNWAVDIIKERNRDILFDKLESGSL